MDLVKFTFAEKATKIDMIFIVNLTVCSDRQIDGEDLVNFCGLLRKHELYPNTHLIVWVDWAVRTVLKI